MKKNVFKLVALVVCLVLATSVGFALKDNKTPSSKSTETKEKLKEQPQKQQIKLKTPIVAPKDDKSQAEVEQDRTQVSPLYLGLTAGEQIKRQVISSGGRKGNSASYKQWGSLSQASVGKGSSASFGLGAGFWQGLGPGGPAGLCGDVNSDEQINLSDPICLANYYFGKPCSINPWASDVNCDALENLGDALIIANYYFGTPGFELNCCE